MDKLEQLKQWIEKEMPRLSQKGCFQQKYALRNVLEKIEELDKAK